MFLDLFPAISRCSSDVKDGEHDVVRVKVVVGYLVSWLGMPLEHQTAVIPGDRSQWIAETLQHVGPQAVKIISSSARGQRVQHSSARLVGSQPRYSARTRHRYKALKVMHS